MPKIKNFIKKVISKIKKHKRNILLGVVGLGILMISSGASFLVLSLLKIKADTDEKVVISSEKPSNKINNFNVLLLGYGGAGHDGGYLTDVLIVVSIDSLSQKATLISIPRDLWVEIPVRSDLKTYQKINTAYAVGFDDNKYPLKEPKYKGEIGATRLAKEIVGEVVGMPIDHVVAVNFAGFSESIDILGSIEVDVPVAFNDYFYPVKGLENETCGKSSEEIAEFHDKYSGFDLEKQFECRYEHLHFDRGVQFMDGETVLKFVRSRHSSEHGGDFARSQRQHAVLVAIKNKVLSLGAIDEIVPFVNKFSDTIRTDINEEKLIEISKAYSNPSEYKVSTINLNEDNVLMSSTSTDGQFILVPKEGTGKWTQTQSFIGEQD